MEKEKNFSSQRTSFAQIGGLIREKRAFIRKTGGKHNRTTFHTPSFQKWATKSERTTRNFQVRWRRTAAMNTAWCNHNPLPNDSSKIHKIIKLIRFLETLPTWLEDEWKSLVKKCMLLVPLNLIHHFHNTGFSEKAETIQANVLRLTASYITY